MALTQDKLDELKRVVSSLLTDVGVSDQDSGSVIEKLESHVIENGSLYDDPNLGDGVFITAQNWLEKTKQNVGSPTDPAHLGIKDTAFAFKPIYGPDGNLKRISISSMLLNSDTEKYIMQNTLLKGVPIDVSTQRLGLLSTGFGNGQTTPVFSGNHHSYGTVITDRNAATLGNYINEKVMDTLGFNSTEVDFANPYRVLNNRNSLSPKNTALNNRLFEHNRAVSNISILDTYNSPLSGNFHLDNMNLVHGQTQFGLLGSFDKKESVKYRFLGEVVNKVEASQVSSKEATLDVIAKAFDNRLKGQLDAIFESKVDIKNLEHFEKAFDQMSKEKSSMPFVFGFSKESYLNSAKDFFTGSESSTLQEHLYNSLGFKTISENYRGYLNTATSNVNVTDNKSAAYFTRLLLGDIKYGMHAGVTNALQTIQKQITVGSSNVYDLLMLGSKEKNTNLISTWMPAYQKIYSSLNTSFSSPSQNYVNVNTPLAINGKNVNFEMNLTDLTIENFDTHTSFVKKAPGLALLEELEMKHKYNQSRIKRDFGIIERAAEAIRTNNSEFNFSGYQKILSEISSDFTRNLVSINVASGDFLSLTEMSQRNQTIVKGKSMTIGHGVAGDLSFLNKIGQRAWQSLDALPDYVKRQNGKLENVTRNLVEYKLNKKNYDGPLLDPNAYVNQNLDKFDALNRRTMELFDDNRFGDFSNVVNYKGEQVSTRGSVQTLAFDVFGDLRGGEYDAGRFTFNENAILHQDISDVLVASKYRTGYITAAEISENIDNAGFLELSLEEQLKEIKKNMVSKNVKTTTSKTRRISVSKSLAKETAFNSNTAVDVFKEINSLANKSQSNVIEDKINSIKKIRSLSSPKNVNYKNFSEFESIANGIYKTGNKDLIEKFNNLKSKREPFFRAYKEAVGEWNVIELLESLQDEGDTTSYNIVKDIFDENTQSKKSFVDDTLSLIDEYKKYFSTETNNLNGSLKKIKRNQIDNSDAMTVLRKYAAKNKGTELADRALAVLSNYNNLKDELIAEESTSVSLKERTPWSKFFRKNMKFEKSYSFDDYEHTPDLIDHSRLNFEQVFFDKENKRFVFGFSEVQKAKNGSKIHAGSTEKFTAGHIAKNIKVGDQAFGVVSSTKSLNRGFTGSDISSFIKTGLHLSRDKADDFLSALQKDGILNDLGYYIQKTDKGYSFNDSNAGFSAKASLDELLSKVRNVVDNPYLEEHIKGSKTVARLSKKYKNSEEIIAKINNIYESTIGVKNLTETNKIFGVFDLTIDGTVNKVFGIKKLETLALSSSHGSAPLSNALKFDSFAARFLETKGYFDLARIIAGGSQHNFSELVDAKNAVPNNVIDGAKNSADFAKNLLDYEHSAGSGNKSRHLNFNSDTVQHLKAALAEAKNDLTTTDFMKLLKQHGGFSENAVDNVFSPINGKAISVFSYSYEGTGFDYLKQQIADTVKAGFMDESASDFRAAFDSYEKFLDDNMYGNSKRFGTPELQLEYKNVYNTLFNAVDGLHSENSLDPSFTLLRNIIKKADGTYDRKNIFKTYQLLKDATKSSSIDSSFNSFYVNKNGVLGFSDFSRKLKNADALNNFKEYDEIGKSLLSGQKFVDNHLFMKKLDEFKLAFDAGQHVEIDSFGRSFFSTLVNGAKNMDGNITHSFFDSLKNYRAAYAQAPKGTRTAELYETLAADFNSLYGATINNNYRVANNHLTKTSKNFIRKMTTSIFTANNFEQLNVTRRHSVFSDSKSIKIGSSISGKTTPGTQFLNELESHFNKIDSADGLEVFKNELDTFFGKTVTDEFLLEGIDLKNISEANSKIFRRNIDKLENITILSEDFLRTGAGKTSLAAFSESAEQSGFLKGVNGFVGMLNRHPHQSSEHFMPALSFLANSKKGGLINKLLAASGFHENNSGFMAIGKKTALAMYGDYDGDSFYFADLRKTIEASKDGYSFEKYSKQGMAEILSLRGSTKDLGKWVNNADEISEFLPEIQDFADTYNHILEERLNFAKKEHMNPRQLIYASSETMKAYAEGIANGDLTDTAKNTLAKKIIKLAGDENALGEKYYGAFEEAFGGNEAVLKGLTDLFGQRLINPKLLEAGFAGVVDTANIAHTGMVWHSMNSRRNAGQIVAGANTSEKALKGFYKAEYAKSMNLNYNDISKGSFDDFLKGTLSKAQGDLIGKDGTWSDLSAGFAKAVDSVKTNRATYDAIYATAIQSGVISSKKSGQKSFYQTIDNITKYSFNNDNEMRETLDELDNIIKGSREDMFEFLTKVRTSFDTKYSLLEESFSSMQSEEYFGDSYFANYDEIGKDGFKASSFTDKDYNAALSKIKKTKAIYATSVGLSDVDDFLSIGKKTNGFVDRFQNFLGKIGLDINWSTKAGRNKTISELVTEGDSFSVSSSDLSENEKIIGKSTRKTTLREAEFYEREVERQADVISQDARVAEETVEYFENRGTTADNVAKTAEKVDSFAGRFETLSQYAKANKTKTFWVGAGLLAIGAFLGYNAHRNVVSSYDEDQKNGPLGAVPGSTLFKGPNDLGYLNYHNKKGR